MLGIHAHTHTHTQGALTGIDIQTVFELFKANRQTARALKIIGSNRQTANPVIEPASNRRFEIIWFKLSNRTRFENNLVQTVKLRV